MFVTLASCEAASTLRMTVVGGAASNRTMNFANDLQMAYGNARGDTTNAALATLNLNNDGTNTYGSILNIGGNLWAGYTNSNWDQQNSAASINIGSKSQLNLGGSIYLNGSGPWNGSGWDPALYNLNLAATPTDGAVSFKGGLFITSNDNYGNASLTVGSGSAAAISASQFNMATSYSSQGTFTMGGARTLTVAAADNYMATGNSDIGQSRYNMATINLSDSAKLNFNGNLTMGVERNSDPSWVNVNLANTSQLNVGNILYFNGTFNLGATAQVNATDLSLRGGN